MKVLHQYKNGNVDVTIYEDGTKTREWEDEQHVEFFEHCDIKLTNKCSLGDRFDDFGNLIARSKTCEFCHEMSNNRGSHADLAFVEHLWREQPVGTELACGGGNILEHPDIDQFLFNMSRKGFFPNVTINSLHLKPHAKQIRELQKNKCFYGMGISYRGKEYMKNLPLDISYDNSVFHLILGLNDFSDCMTVIDWCKENHVLPKILLLGYKQYGNGVSCYTSELQTKINKWKFDIMRLMSVGGLTVSFDNLAIKQIGLKGYMPEEDWNRFYLGTDGLISAYIDSVAKKVAKSSTSDIRYEISNEDTTLSIFNKVKV